MKHFFSLLLAGSLCTAGTSVYAQQSPDRLRSEAVEATRLLANRIALDDARTMRVRNLVYERLVQESQINTLYSNDPAMRQNKLRVVEQEYVEKLKTLLTAPQFQRYEALAAGASPSNLPQNAVSVLKTTSN